MNELSEYHRKNKIGFNSKVYQNEEIVRRFIEHVCWYYNVSFFDIVSKSRRRIFVVPRQVILTIVKENLVKRRYTLQEVGELCDRDHSSVIHSEKCISDLVFADRQLRDAMKIMRQRWLHIKSELIGQKENAEFKETVFNELLYMREADGLLKEEIEFWKNRYKYAQ